MVAKGGREEQIVNERLRKVQDLRDSGVNPYPSRFVYLNERVFSMDIVDKYCDLEDSQKSDDRVVVAGRIMNKRNLGKLVFCKLQDVKGSIQLVFQKDETPENVFSLFKKVDSGDIVGVKGEVIKTKTGEISILVGELYVLSKSVNPLPEKWHGLKDEEDRLRKRYLDIIMNDDVRDLFVKKQKFWNSVRGFLNEKGFLEVETPVLETSAGGALATPFKTHHNALDIDLYLRISMGELWQKKALVAGYEKTFEIGRQFRNEGMDSEHLQDYTQMEFYWGYAGFEDGMKLVEDMYRKIALDVLGTLKFKRGEHYIDLGKKWERYDFESLIENETGINVYDSSKEDIVRKLKELSVEYEEGADKWDLVDVLWKYCRKRISGPGFLLGHPVELSPLAKRSESDPRKVERFQVIIGGSENGNGYSELNDPVDQEKRFRSQRADADPSGEVGFEHDESFLEALRYGMPPACGFGFSERLFSFLMDKPIRECVMFPLMRPERNDPVFEENDKQDDVSLHKPVISGLVGDAVKTHQKNEEEREVSGLPIGREEAIEILNGFEQDKADKNHYLSSEAVMRGVAKKIGEDEDYWGMLGLLHDVDWAFTKDDVPMHTLKAEEILRSHGFDDEFIQILQSHTYGCAEVPENMSKERGSKVEHALAASETLTGIIYAYALMRDGRISDMDVKGLKKKFKDKNFAKNCNRDIVKEIEEVGISLDGFFAVAIDSMKEIKDLIGLE